MAFLLRPTSGLSVNDSDIIATQRRFKSPIQSFYITFRWPIGDISPIAKAVELI
jgi:hypothetical protein